MTPRLRGILLMAMSMAVFAVLDASAKYAMQSLPPPVAVFFRYIVALVLSAVLILQQGGYNLFLTRRLGLHVLRGLLLVMSTGLNFIAISKLQLAQTAAISFTIPLWVCALSIPFLGEQVGPRRWAAVIVGFLGVLVIMRPGTGGFHWAMLLSMGAALAGAIYNIATRKVGGSDRAETSLFYVCLVGSAGAALPFAGHWQMPQGFEWLILGLMGLCGSAGHWLLIEAHRLAPASVLAPFVYTQIVWMILLGFLVFGDVPDGWTLFGGLIVIASGLYVYARERTLGRPAIVAAGAD